MGLFKEDNPLDRNFPKFAKIKQAMEAKEIAAPMDKGFTCSPGKITFVTEPNIDKATTDQTRDDLLGMPSAEAARQRGLQQAAGLNPYSNQLTKAELDMVVEQLRQTHPKAVQPLPSAHSPLGQTAIEQMHAHAAERARQAQQSDNTLMLLRPVLQRIEIIEDMLRAIDKKLDTLQTAGFYLNED